MSIRWDALLVRHTALELARALVGARVRALRLDGDSRDLTLLLEDRALLWALHPTRGWPRVVGPMKPAEGDLPLKGRITAVRAPPDERIVRIELRAAADRALELVVELMGNQWNALVLEGEPPVIRHVLWRRDRGRVQHVGERWVEPRPLSRRGVDGEVSEAEWSVALEKVPDEDRAAALVHAFAWTSPLNAPAVLGAPSEPGADAGLAVGHERWQRMVRASTAAEPVLLEVGAAPQPYPFPLAGTPHRPAETLLAAFGTCAAIAGAPAPPPGLDPELLAGLEDVVKRANARVRHLDEELAALPDATRLRALGDLVLARYADIPQGAASARLVGFDGEAVTVELDPAEPPHTNAARYYREATKSERAAARLPEMLVQAKAARDRTEELLARARSGTADEEELRAALGGAPRPRGARTESSPSLPYRVFRSSGGLEIRVGRGARHNDALTFKHSSPGDVWLHARHVGGAHVILRWPGPGNPPSRDLSEAAMLAALHSKARTSSSVPVDWTFRKYVRKPRKAPPGRVSAERVETLFVSPDAKLMGALPGDLSP